MDILSVDKTELIDSKEVRQVLNLLKKQGIKTIIISNKSFSEVMGVDLEKTHPTSKQLKEFLKI